MTPIRIVIADDHPFFRFGLRARLSAEPEMEVVGEAGTAEEAITLATQLTPDVILMDLNFNQPGIGGLDAIRRISEAQPQVALLVITMFDDDRVFAAIRAGARGYLLKDAEPDETIRAIRAVYHGEAIFSPAVAQRVIEYFGSARPRTPSQAFPELTKREREILTLIAQGYTNAAIADHLTLSPRTVRNQVSSIYSKLQLANRASAIILARDHGVV